MEKTGAIEPANLSAPSAVASPACALFGVERSASGRFWRTAYDEHDPACIRQARMLVQRHGLSDVVARILVGRGVETNAAAHFLSPRLRDLLPDPSVLSDMDAAAALAADMLAQEKPIAIFGDYDVDGATSAALLARAFRAFGHNPRIHIPDRLIDGYGPNISIVRDLHAAGVQLLVTVDCGTTSHKPLAEARRLGMRVIVLDHHQIGDRHPDVDAFVNPNRADDVSGQGHLAAVGVAFLFLIALHRELRRRGHDAEIDLLALLDLVALGTICDLVPLTGLNRALAAQGLRVMGARTRVGIDALCAVAGLSGAVDARDCGFVLGPRINAGGRIGDAALGVRLLSSDDGNEARAIAGRLDTLNRERQALEALMLEAAEDQARAAMARDPDRQILTVAATDWHPGIVGLIAGRLTERHRRPALAIALGGGPDGVSVGSARSIPGVDIGALIRAAVAMGAVAKGGGHAMAAGLTLNDSRPETIATLAGYLEDNFARSLPGLPDRDPLTIDATLGAGGASLSLVEDIARLAPFGQGNPEPIFGFANLRVAHAAVVGQDGRHIRARLTGGDGATVEAIAFRWADRPAGELLLGAAGQCIHAAGCVSKNVWQGVQRSQLRLIDIASAGDR